MWRDNIPHINRPKAIARKPLSRSPEAEQRRFQRRREQTHYDKGEDKREEWLHTSPETKRELAGRHRARVELEGTRERDRAREAARRESRFDREARERGERQAADREKKARARTEASRRQRSIFPAPPTGTVSRRDRRIKDERSDDRRRMSDAYSEFSEKYAERNPRRVAERPESREGDRGYHAAKAAARGVSTRRRLRKPSGPHWGRGGRRRRGGRTKRRKGRRRRCPKTGKPICYCKKKRKSRRGGRRTRKRR